MIYTCFVPFIFIYISNYRYVIYNLYIQYTCETPTKMFCKRLSQDTAKTCMYTFDTDFYIQWSIPIILSLLWYPKILNYHCLTFQMRLLDLSLEILSLPEIPCLQIARYQGSRIITPRRGCFHKGSAHSPQGPEDEASKHVAFRRSKQWLQHFLTKQRHPKIFPIFCWSLKFHVNLISIFDKLLREIEHDDGTRFVDVFQQKKMHSCIVHHVTICVCDYFSWGFSYSAYSLSR